MSIQDGYLYTGDGKPTRRIIYVCKDLHNDNRQQLEEWAEKKGVLRMLIFIMITLLVVVIILAIVLSILTYLGI